MDLSALGARPSARESGTSPALNVGLPRAGAPGQAPTSRQRVRLLPGNNNQKKKLTQKQAALAPALPLLGVS